MKLWLLKLWIIESGYKGLNKRTKERLFTKRLKRPPVNCGEIFTTTTVNWRQLLFLFKKANSNNYQRKSVI